MFNQLISLCSTYKYTLYEHHIRSVKNEAREAHILYVQEIL